MGSPDIQNNSNSLIPLSKVSLQVSDVVIASSGIVLDGIPTNEKGLVESGHRKILLSIEINGGRLVAWIKRNGNLYEIRSQGTEGNLVSYGLTEEQAVENIEEILKRMLSKSELRLLK